MGTQKSKQDKKPATESIDEKEQEGRWLNLDVFQKGCCVADGRKDDSSTPRGEPMKSPVAKQRSRDEVDAFLLKIDDPQAVKADDDSPDNHEPVSPKVWAEWGHWASTPTSSGSPEKIQRGKSPRRRDDEAKMAGA
eukprot:gnl/TRDRNA2_/TRDRNA2_34280_c0_seq1.p1 gnl/TRDRNA2_/TRDRNA2_34280_c0~~gnl/TRDRNA2_/TRDRNA2_34280_c0_seq1.p1  ORF type:complete len:149 (-),score=30.25 gnl/TRDRNA2_/TRDRNA2_34280_c0_seq1:85-492(-)